jgi:hypothetical protein
MLRGCSIIWLSNLAGPVWRRISSIFSSLNRLAALLALVLGVNRVVAVRRADVELQPARHQDIADLGQPLAQLLALARRVAGVRHLDVVTDHDVRPRARDVRGDAARE